MADAKKLSRPPSGSKDVFFKAGPPRSSSISSFQSPSGKPSDPLLDKATTDKLLKDMRRERIPRISEGLVAPRYHAPDPMRSSIESIGSVSSIPPSLSGRSSKEPKEDGSLLSSLISRLTILESRSKEQAFEIMTKNRQLDEVEASRDRLKKDNDRLKLEVERLKAENEHLRNYNHFSRHHNHQEDQYEESRSRSRSPSPRSHTFSDDEEEGGDSAHSPPRTPPPPPIPPPLSKPKWQGNLDLGVRPGSALSVASSVEPASRASLQLVGDKWSDPWSRGVYDIEQIRKVVEELNDLADPTEIRPASKQEHVHKLKAAKPVQLFFYRNGVAVGSNGPFRPYSWQLTQAFMHDLVDGYFPYEFKQSYPEGVPFEVVDRTSESRDSEREPVPPQAMPSGPGRVLGAQPPSSIVAPLPPQQSQPTSNVRGMSDILRQNEEELKQIEQRNADIEKALAEGAVLATAQEPEEPQGPVSQAQFLRNLPQSIVTKDGKVIPIRDEIQDVLKGGKSEGPENLALSTPALTHLRQRQSEGQPPDHPITILQVRSSSGGQVLVVHMFQEQTVGELRALLDKHRRSKDEYEIRTAFPNRVYSDPNETLKAVGLVPNANVIIRTKS